MKRLWVQITFAFVFVAAVSVAVVALLANAQTSADFRLYLARTQVQESGLVERLQVYYVNNPDWQGVEAVLAQAQPQSSGGGPRGPGAGMGGGGQAGPPGTRPSLQLILTNLEGQLIAASPSTGALERLSRSELADALPLFDDQQQPIGYLFVGAPPDPQLSLVASSFLARVNLALLQAGLLATLLSTLLGLLLARGLAAPLTGLAAGVRRLAGGDFSQRLPLRGPSEVAAAAQAFNEMAAALDQAETSRRQMVADIAHELRTPLSVIQGNLRAILDDVYPLSKAEIATIYDATLGLRRLVDDLRELSLAEAGRLSLQLRRVEVTALMAHSAALFGEAAAQRGIELQFQAEAALPAIQGDPDRVAQVLNNLLANGVRHARTRLQLRAAVAGPMLQFEVIDDGPGIAAADLAHVFDRFWRADLARSRDSGGSGLGLAIARQLITLQHGQIGVESSPGQGTRFWFRLPLAPPE